MQNAHEFVAHLNQQFALKHQDKPSRPVFFVKSGPVYDKIWYQEAYREGQPGGAVYCFVNAAGEIFKAAGWSKPAKGVRARITDLAPEFAAQIADHGYATTAWLYR